MDGPDRSAQLRKLGGDAGRMVTRLMGRLERVSLTTTWIAGIAALIAVLLLDTALRVVNIRLVPLYLPVQCVAFWTMRRRSALLFAVLTAVIAVVPDVVIASDPMALTTIINAAIRASAYLFLAFIVTAYRGTYDDADLRAMYDGLTGVLNKMPFQAAVERQLAEMRRSHQTLLIAFVDLDGFKGINTHHGHAVGDTLLRDFAQEAMAAVRGSDVVGRLGGDEFGFMLTAASMPNAEALAHVLHQRLVNALAKSGLLVSCSMGALVMLPQATLSAAELLHMADCIMLQAKSDGKGRVITRRVVTNA